MAKIQARNVDDGLYELILQSSMKNERTLEGEIRFALQDYYRPVTPENDVPVLSRRERWQRETGARLLQLLDRVTADGLFPELGREQLTYTRHCVHVARLLGVTTGTLMDLTEGHLELPFPLADDIAGRFSASEEWLLTGEGSPFPVQRIGSNYRDFFMPDGQPDNNLVFELIRIGGGRHDGTLLCLRYSPEVPRNIAQGVVTEQFKLAAGMGETGHANLKAFLTFLKTDCAALALNAFSWTPDDANFDFWSVMGQHHPVYFQNAGRRTSARWLQQLLNGEDPGDWFAGWTSSPDEIRTTGKQAGTE
ncbi:hypothetical protein KZF77_004706 [Escherichia coli]|nr:hypothetical protein [Escherichia coli]